MQVLTYWWVPHILDSYCKGPKAGGHCLDCCSPPAPNVMLHMLSPTMWIEYGSVFPYTLGKLKLISPPVHATSYTDRRTICQRWLERLIAISPSFSDHPSLGAGEEMMSVSSLHSTTCCMITINSSIYVPLTCNVGSSFESEICGIRAKHR